MPTSLRNVCLDAADPYALATFWSHVVDRPVGADCEPGAEETYIEMPEGPDLYFQRVPDSKIVKNRVHVCLTPEIKRDEEVERLRALGATFVGDHRDPDGTGWVVLAGAEGGSWFGLWMTEGKAVKNRLHLDLRVGRGRAVPLAERRTRVDAHVAALFAAGSGSVLRGGSDADHYGVFMADPEGNEFCVV